MAAVSFKVPGPSADAAAEERLMQVRSSQICCLLSAHRSVVFSFL